MVSVRVSETYDLSTMTDKMGIVGIHTPIGPLIERMYPGLCMQYEKFRFVSCDVSMACASLLPADPLQIGTETGDIAPQDMFNPILYRAVSNDSMNNFLQFIQLANSYSGDFSTVAKNSIIEINNPDFTVPVDPESSVDYEDADQFAMYYAILADSDGWRKAMPQAGLQMRGLYPLVYSVISSYGLNNPYSTIEGEPPNDGPSSDSGFIGASSGGTSSSYIAHGPALRSGSYNATSYGMNPFRGPAMRMPSVNTKSFTSSTFTDTNVVPGSSMVDVYNSTPNPLSQDYALQCNVGRVPPTYVGLIVLPPARLNKLYYRLKVTWTIEFSNLQASTNVMTWRGLQNVGGLSYGSDYETQAGIINTTNLAMLDTLGADADKVMESA